MRSTAIKGLRYSLLLASGSLSMAAYAQAPSNPSQVPSPQAGEAPSGTPTADIIVTAQRRAESLQKVPMTVNVATGDQIQKLSILSVKDIQQLAAGLEITNNDGRTNVATIRGITFKPDSGATPAVDVYFNEIPVDAQSFFTAIYDVGQIEVLRGPQGIYRGRTSPAGSITITSRRANLDKPEGYFEITGTNRDAVNAQGGASVPLIPGKLAVRLSGLVDSNRVGNVRNITLDKRSSSQTISGRLSLNFQPTERFRTNLTYQYLWSDTTPFIAAFGPGNAPFAGAAGIPGFDINLGGFIDPTVRNGPPLTIGDRKSVSSSIPRFQNESHLVTFDTEYDLTDNITWSFNAGYQHTVLKQQLPLDYTNAVPGVPREQRLRIPPQSLTFETRVSSDGPDFLNWMVGAFYQRSRSVTTVEQDTPLLLSLPSFGLNFPLPPVAPFIVPIDIGLTIPNKGTTTAVFGSARLNFTDRLRLEAGLRYTRYWSRGQSFLSACAAIPGVPCTFENFPTKTPENEELVFKALTGGANLSFDLTPSATAYVAYGRSYRPGVAASGITFLVSQDLVFSDPEKSDSVEIGLKTSLLGGRVSLNVDAFYQKFDGYIDYFAPLFVRGINAATGQVGIGAIPTSTNGDAISKGVELQLNGRLTRDWDLGFNASYVNAHYDDAVMPCNVTDANGQIVIPVGQETAVCTRNDRIAQVPKFMASLNSEYRFHMGDLTPFIRGLVRYRPGFNSTIDNYEYRTFTNVNLFVGVRGRDDRWEITAFAKNLLNQARATSFVSAFQGQVGTVDALDTSAEGPSFLSGYRTAVVSNPREFGLTARFNW